MTKNQKSKVFSVLKQGGEILGTIGGAVLTVMSRQELCRRGQHEIGTFGSCRHCGTRPVTHVITHVVTQSPVMHTMVTGGCSHQWAKSNSSTVCCLACGKTMTTWSYDEGAWARAILNQLS